MERINVNFIVNNKSLKANEDLLPMLFGEETTIPIAPDYTIYDILTMLGLFPSKSEARKNWKRTGKDIPVGFTSLEGVGKMRHNIYIWNPIGETI